MGVADPHLFAQLTAPADDLRPMPRALLVFAHPDDETIALGGRLGRFRGAHLVHVTDGAPTNTAESVAHGYDSLVDYRNARWQELESALRTAGLEAMSREHFDVPDQEAGFQLAGLTRRLVTMIRAWQPQAIVTHPYEGGHPDHDACAFAVHHAVWMLRSLKEAAPLIVEAPFYHSGPLGMETGTFLPADPPVPEVILPLSGPEQERKRLLLACFTSQREMLKYFGTDEERYRVAPAYDFRQPPQQGDAFYDHHSWGMSSRDFSELVVEAEETLEEELKTACC